MQDNNISNKNKLVRTDSTTICHIGYKNTVGTKLSPLGRERRIKKWQNELISEYYN